MSRDYKFIVFVGFLCLFMLSPNGSVAQQESDILESYEDYTASAREVVYMHLNKSTYIKGESIGFTAYVMDKKNKKPSLLTTNLYVSIEDANANVVKQKLIYVDNGMASNTFEIDSLFTSGYYTVKAYTNWMLNFSEQNYYAESIRIIDSETEEYIEAELTENVIDAQFLPESGHLLKDVINNVGVVIKDKNGFGIPNAKGTLVDNENKVISSFETNGFGIGKFQMLPGQGDTYKVNLSYANKDFTRDLDQPVEPKGVIMTVKRLKSKVYISLVTNSATLEDIKGKRHTLMIHNGDNFDIMDIYFTDDTTVTKVLDLSNCAPGTNILTLFNDEDLPIAERLFFNYNGINVLSSEGIQASRSRDSVTVNLNFESINPKTINSISVSVLPKDTKSYNRHNSIISYTFLQPYLKGVVEQAKYYFEDITPRKEYELDNLLLTQGWSSYDWNAIFSDVLDESKMFEQGIRIKANLTKALSVDPNNSYLMHAVADEEPRIFDLNDGDNSFLIDNLFPVGQNELYFSRITKVNGLLPAALYLQSFPSKIPRLNLPAKSLRPKHEYRIEASMNSEAFKDIDIDRVQTLDEVVLTSELDRNRVKMREINKNRFGRVSVIDEEDRLLYNTLADFLVSKGYEVIEENGTISVRDRQSYVDVTPNGPNPGPVFYLDDLYLQDTNILFQYSLINVDYIEINRLGIGEGSRGGQGVIKIYSSIKGSKSKNNQDTVQAFKLPLSFSAEKKFYVPKYKYYNTDFYKGYGVIDWKPRVVIDESGTASFKMARPKGEFTLFLEGIANDGDFIYEEKSIVLN